jgi:hypothetical protein
LAICARHAYSANQGTLNNERFGANIFIVQLRNGSKTFIFDDSAQLLNASYCLAEERAIKLPNYNRPFKALCKQGAQEF